MSRTSTTAGGEDPHNSTEAPNAPTQTWEEEFESTEEEEDWHCNFHDRWEYVQGPYGWTWEWKY
eukprot:6924586-Prorocentrum_lima.AAC.1